MTTSEDQGLSYTAFKQHTRVASGELQEVALTLRGMVDSGDTALVLIFDDRDGKQLDIDLGGSIDDLAARFASDPPDNPKTDQPPKKRGRPKLGVVGREVTLLPRHWEWLQSQRGGPSATIRRLVDEARASNRSLDRARHAQDSINRFISAIAGDLAGFEEATRALYRGERARFEGEIRSWPADIRSQVERWASDAFEKTDAN